MYLLVSCYGCRHAGLRQSNYMYVGQPYVVGLWCYTPQSSAAPPDWTSANQGSWTAVYQDVS